jgi:ice-binding like protein
MSAPTHLKRTGRAVLALAAVVAFLAIPATAQAAPVDLGTASPFVVLGGAAVTNTGPSVLNGDLGVSPGTALSGFGLPAVVNGATHNNDGVAAQAKSDLTTAYVVAAGQAATANLTGTNLGNRTLTAGAYRYSSSAQLTGQLTLDAQGDPNAQFVFMIGSTLTTASASSVILTNGASPCNVYWQVGSSATLGSTTAFQGNVLALTSISLNNGVTVIGRMLARNGQVSLINDVLTRPLCSTGSGGGSGGSGGSGGNGGSGGGNTGPGGRRGLRVTHNGTARVHRVPRAACTAGFRAAVRGHLIQRVVFRLDGKRISSQIKSPFRVLVRGLPGRHHVTARVTFKDATRAKTLRMRYRRCAAAVLQPRQGPSQFTG